MQDPNNLALEFNIPQIAQVSWTYQLPFGCGKRFGSNWNKVVEGVLGAWEVNGMYRWDDGLPLILYLNGGVNVPTFGAQRPNLPTSLTQSGTVGPNTNYFTNAAGAQAAPVPYAYPSGYTGDICYSDPWYPCQSTNGNAPRELQLRAKFYF